MKRIKILLVEDSQSYREVISLGLSNEVDFEVCAEFNNTDAALEYLRENNHPEVILLDLNLPGKNGLEALPELLLEAPNTDVLVLTQSEKEADILQAIKRGAKGYLLKESSMKEIITGIRDVLSGGSPLDPTMARYVLSQFHTDNNKDDFFSERELEVLKYLSQGLSQKEIGKEMNLSPKTIDFHLGKIYKKLDVPNAPAAVAKAYDRGSLR